MLWWWVVSNFSNVSRKTVIIVYTCFTFVHSAYRLIFVYNFYVYLITGKQFRSDLHKLLCRCLPSSSAPALAHAHAHGAPARVVAVAIAADDNDDDNDDVEVARRGRTDTAV